MVYTAPVPIAAWPFAERKRKTTVTEPERRGGTKKVVRNGLNIQCRTIAQWIEMEIGQTINREISGKKCRVNE